MKITMDYEKYKELEEQLNKLESLVYSIYVEAVDNNIELIQKLIESEKEEYIGLIPSRNFRLNEVE